jgi:glycosyltransferase involved in cell wall biosynthesis
MKLSILVCSVLNRRDNFLPIILEELNSQTYDKLDVEVICVVDNKTRMLGIKRNDLVNMAQGDYVVFVDDDDKLSPDYVSELLKAIDSCDGADVINFIVNVSINGSPFKPCYYSVAHGHDFNREDSYHRLPNHIMCIKRELCLSTPYKPILRGEDSAFSLDLAPKIKKEFDILKVLYEYHFNQNTTEAQQYLQFKRRR